MAANTGDKSPSGGELITWGVAERSLAGEATSGDLFLVTPVAAGVLLAVVDGLGHGAEAAAAARRAAQTLQRFADQPLTTLVARCHDELKYTRGVVMSLAAYHPGDRTLTWLGVGNVECVLYRTGVSGGPPERLNPRRGVVGYQLPALRCEALQVAAGDTLVMATDGIRSEFADETPSLGSPQQLADHILQRYGKSSDDALALVVRLQGADHADAVG